MFFNGIQCQIFKTNVGVKHGCLLSPVLFNLFLEDIMAGIQDEHIYIYGYPQYQLMAEIYQISDSR